MRRATVLLILVTVLVILSSSRSLISVSSGAPDPSPKGMTFSSDSAGNKKDVFLPTEDVYAYGVGLVKSANYRIYIVTDTTMKDGDPIPPSASGTTTTDITTDGNGSFGPSMIWSATPTPLTPGYYDIIADCLDAGTEGIFDREWDAEDTIEASGTYGFFVIPETPLGTITVLLASFTATLIIKRKRIF